jgi:hypothetical protein
LGSRLYKDLQNTTEEGRWQGARWLAAGTFGAAGMWVKGGPTNNIIDRMVFKESVPYELMWNNPEEWRNKLPREIEMHRRIDGSRTANSHLNVIQHRGHRLMMTERRYRLYLDLCDGGGLDDSM